MQLSEEQIQQLEEMGSAFTTVDDCAIILQVPVNDLREVIADKLSTAHAAYNRGRLQSEFEVRQSIVTQAKAGSSPGQVLAMKLINELKMTDA